MKKFEYKTTDKPFYYKGTLEEYLNGHGVEGWELVEVVNGDYIWKREV